MMARPMMRTIHTVLPKNRTRSCWHTKPRTHRDRGSRLRMSLVRKSTSVKSASNSSTPRVAIKEAARIRVVVVVEGATNKSRARRTKTRARTTIRVRSRTRAIKVTSSSRSLVAIRRTSGQTTTPKATLRLVALVTFLEVSTCSPTTKIRKIPATVRTTMQVKLHGTILELPGAAATILAVTQVRMKPGAELGCRQWRRRKLQSS
jgi:hypothetical protein